MGTSSVNVGRDVANVNIPLKREDTKYTTILHGKTLFVVNFEHEPIIDFLSSVNAITDLIMGWGDKNRVGPG